MFLEINDSTTIKEIQQTFSDFYPYLRICFFKKSHGKYEASDEKKMLSPDQLLGEVRKTHVSALLEIQPGYKVANVEEEFQRRFGLSVQVLKMEKGEWVQTTGMDDFTLKELNEFSRSADDGYIISDINEDESGE
ncbi:hypothetical protein [Flavihumibacter fluvii]|uniref:hypothetical protein n=1 Tax=Flavihumibacter fluvii TaxID=2838157 RepID=UPI001BDE6EDE|nr:hypothetical protein [Flavihumibacter fluvii]ULQ52477.1 hypothetical protein KJS93_20525 [Flavihumibacter fluvii]